MTPIGHTTNSAGRASAHEEGGYMMKIVLTIKLPGLPTRRITGIWPTTCDAAAFGIEIAGAGARISAKVAP